MAHLSDLLARVRRRWFATVALRTIGFAGAAAGLTAFAAIALDLALAPGGAALIILGTSAVLLSVAAAVSWFPRVERRPDDRRVARFVEERAATLPRDRCAGRCGGERRGCGCPAGSERAAFRSLIVAAATRRLEGVTPANLVTRDELRRAGLIAAAGVGVLAVAVIAGLPSLNRAFETARLKFFPHSISVEVLPGTTRVVAGQPLTVRARVHAGGRGLSARFSPNS